MADDYEDETEEAPRLQGAPSPFLEEFQNVFGPAAPEQVGEVTTRLNDYFQRRQIADATEAAGQQFVNDLDGFKSGLVSMVTNDPNAIHVAMDIVSPMLEAMGGPPEHRAVLANHMESEIAAAAVTTLAERDEDLARATLAHSRVAGVLGENAEPLEAYIGIQAQARAVDRAAEAEQFAQARSDRADRAAYNYLGSLHDVATGSLTFPPGWNQGLMADANVPPAAKVAVSGVYERLRENGDALSSDPALVEQLVSGLAVGMTKMGEILPQAGIGLRLEDALTLGAHAQPSADRQREMGQLKATLDEARDYLVTPDNGAAGYDAYKKFVNWVLPRYREGGAGSLNPANDQSFMYDPRGGSVLPQFSPKGEQLTAPYRPIPAERPSLADIFARRP